MSIRRTYEKLNFLNASIIALYNTALQLNVIRLHWFQNLLKYQQFILELLHRSFSTYSFNFGSFLYGFVIFNWTSISLFVKMISLHSFVYATVKSNLLIELSSSTFVGILHGYYRNSTAPKIFPSDIFAFICSEYSFPCLILKIP